MEMTSCVKYILFASFVCHFPPFVSGIAAFAAQHLSFVATITEVSKLGDHCSSFLKGTTALAAVGFLGFCEPSSFKFKWYYHPPQRPERGHEQNDEDIC